jgi:hypothetical protein
MIGEGDCGAIGGMKIGRGNQSTRRKPAPVPLCPPLDQTRDRTWAAAVGSQWLTAWAVARPSVSRLGVELITPHFKKQACYKTLHRTMRENGSRSNPGNVHYHSVQNLLSSAQYIKMLWSKKSQMLVFSECTTRKRVGIWSMIYEPIVKVMWDP